MPGIGIIMQHIAISAAGALLGIGLGNLVGNQLKRWSAGKPRILEKGSWAGYFLPWRSLLAILAAIGIFPLIPLPVTMALGRLPGWGIFMVSWEVLPVTIGMRIHLDVELPEDVTWAHRLFSFFRSLAVAAPVLLIYYGEYLGGGLGWMFLQNILLMDTAAYSFGVLLIASILVIDLLGGILQWRADRLLIEKQASEAEWPGWLR